MTDNLRKVGGPLAGANSGRPHIYTTHTTFSRGRHNNHSMHHRHTADIGLLLHSIHFWTTQVPIP